MRIVVVPGTNRKESLSLMLARLVASDYEELGCEVDCLELGEMGTAFLDPNAYKEPAPEVKSMVDRFLSSDGAVFVVPEYNGSYPGVVKLFIDMLPYPEGFDSRPCAFLGLAAGQFKGLRAVEHLQGVAGYRMAHLYPRRVFIGDSFKQFDFESGGLVDEELRERIKEQAAGFKTFIESVKA